MQPKDFNTMSLDFFRSTFHLSAQTCDVVADLLQSDVLISLIRKAKALLAQTSIRVDTSPVMFSAGTFQAMLRKNESPEITLNGAFLKRTKNEALAKRFLILHEIFHLMVHRDEVDFSKLPELNEEILADAFACCALCSFHSGDALAIF